MSSSPSSKRIAQKSSSTKPAKNKKGSTRAAAAKSRQRKGKEGKNQRRDGTLSEQLKVQSDIAKQKAMLQKLKSDNKTLEQELSLEKHMSRLAGSDAALEEVEKLQSIGDKFARRIQQEKRQIEQLDRKIANMQHKVVVQQNKIGGINASRETNKLISKQIRIFEGRLDNALSRYNLSLAQNKALRKRVDKARQERVIFDGIYKKMEKELHMNKRKIRSLTTQAKNAQEARENAKKELERITAEAKDAQKSFEMQWKKMGEEIEKDKSGENDAGEKLVQDGMRKSNEIIGSGDAAATASPGLMQPSQERGLKGRLARSTWAIGKDKIMEQLSSEKVAEYEEAFAKIKEATGIKDIDELVEKFIDAEERNFSLFSHVNELTAEIERLEHSISEIKTDTEKFRGQGVNTDNQRKRILNDLELKFVSAKEKAKMYDAKHHDAVKVVNKLKDGIERIFTRIGCYNAGVAEMLGNQGVTEANMSQYLGIIEQRTYEILQMHAAANNGGSDAVRNMIEAEVVGGVNSSRKRSPLSGSGDSNPTLASQIRRKSAVGNALLEATASAAEKGAVRNASKLSEFDTILGAGAEIPHEKVSLSVEPPRIDSFETDDAPMHGSNERPLPLEELHRKTQEDMKELTAHRKRGPASPGVHE